MATLPDFTSIGGRQAPQPSGGVASYTPQIGAAVERAGGQAMGASEIIADTSLRQDAMVAQSAANKLREKRTLLQYDKDGWQGVREGGAVGQKFVDTYTQRLTDATQAIRDSLENDSQRRQFDLHAEVETLSMRAALLQHQAGETQKFNDTTDNSTVSLGLQSIAQRPTDIINFGTQMESIEAAVRGNGKRNGLPDQQVEVNLGKVRTAAYVSRIQALMHGIPGVVEANPDAAADLFKQVEPILGEQAIRELSPQLVVAGTQAKAQTIGAGLARQFNYLQTGEAIKAIDAMDMPPALKTAVRAEVEHRHAVQQSDEDKSQAQGVSTVMQMLYSGQSKGQILASPQYAALRDKGAVLKAIEDKSYSDLLRANASDARSLQALQRQEMKIHIDGAAAAFKWLDPVTLNATPREKIEALLPTLGRQWTEQLLNRKDSIEKRGPQDAKIDHDDQMAIMQEMGLRPFEKSKSEEGKALIATTASRIERLLTDMQGSGARLTREQKNALMRQEIAKSVSVNTWYGGTDTVPIVELKPDQLPKVVVPPQDVQGIYQEMADLYKRSAGKLTQFEPTQENMARYYLTYRKGAATAPYIPRRPDAK